MKSLIVAFIFLVGVALTALQATNNQKTYGTEKTQHAAGQVSNNAVIDKTGPADNTNDQKPQSDAKTDYHGKLFLNLGSMPCPPGDQECRAKEKERLAVPSQEHF